MGILKDFCKKNKKLGGKSVYKELVSMILCVPALAWRLVCPYVLYDPSSPASNFQFTFLIHRFVITNCSSFTSV